MSSPLTSVSPYTLLLERSKRKYRFRHFARLLNASSAPLSPCPERLHWTGGTTTINILKKSLRHRETTSIALTAKLGNISCAIIFIFFALRWKNPLKTLGKKEKKSWSWKQLHDWVSATLLPLRLPPPPPDFFFIFYFFGFRPHGNVFNK